jgi:ribosomal protein S27AE
MNPLKIEVTEAMACWLKCLPCNEAWKAADLPMEMGELAKLLKKQKCPKCGERKKVVLAKQDDITRASLGRLLGEE